MFYLFLQTQWGGSQLLSGAPNFSVLASFIATMPDYGRPVRVQFQQQPGFQLQWQPGGGYKTVSSGPIWYSIAYMKQQSKGFVPCPPGTQNVNGQCLQTPAPPTGTPNGAPVWPQRIRWPW